MYSFHPNFWLFADSQWKKKDKRIAELSYRSEVFYYFKLIGLQDEITL